MIKFFLTLIFIINSNFVLGMSDISVTKFQTFNDTLKTDSLKIKSDSLSKKVIIDTLKLFEMQGFNDQSDLVINKNQYQRTDYRLPSDYISLTPNGFERNFGLFGQPDELLLFGYGNSNISYLENGLPLNNRINNTFNLNNFQTEYIDSVEIISLSRSFIYSASNNPVSVNFITRNSIEKEPYTRLRLIQGPDEEGSIDAIFNAYIMNKLNLTFEITNASLDSIKANDYYGAWQGSVRLRYLYSKHLNFVGSFRYSTSETRIPGGINKLQADTLNQNIYDSALGTSFVKYKNTYKKNTRYHYNLRALFSLIPKFTSELAGYYQSDLDEFRQNENSSKVVNRLVPVNNDNEIYLWGVYFRQPLKYKKFGLEILSRYENTKYKYESLDMKENISTFSVAGLLSFSFNSNSDLKAFSKYLIVDDLSYFGLGGELNVQLSNQFKFYAGSSFSEKPYNIYEKNLLNDNSKKYTNFLIESKLGYSSNNFKISGGVFFTNQTNFATPYLSATDSTEANFISSFKIKDFKTYGINLNFNGNYSFLNYTMNASYYSTQYDLNISPEYLIKFGLFYSGKLFRDNLDLKAGFQGLLTGNQSGYIYDYQQSRASHHIIQNNQIYTPYEEIIDSSIKLDFLISAIVQERAIVYFIVENILQSDFYIIPFYPIGKNVIRFGISWEFYN